MKAFDIGLVGVEGDGDGLVFEVGLHSSDALFVGNVAFHFAFAVDAYHLFDLEDDGFQVFGRSHAGDEEGGEEEGDSFHCLEK